MERIPSSPPTIAALPSREFRPLWSVMIPVYNCSQYITEAVESVLAQDLGESGMQIEVVDDASTDTNVEALVKNLGKGRVGYYRQPKNVGSLRNFETCINRSKGKLIHLLHGDDRVKDGFYRKFTALFHTYPQAGAAFCNYNFINNVGSITHTNKPEAQKEQILENWLFRLAERQRIQYASIVVRREVYETLGSFYGVSYGEDWEMWVRIARYYQVAYTPEVLAQYRTHAGSITWKKTHSDKFYSDLLFVVNLIKEHLPEKDKKRISKKSKLGFALSMLGITYRNWEHSQDLFSTKAYINQTLKLSRHPLVISHVVNIYYKIIKEKTRKCIRSFI